MILNTNISNTPNINNIMDYVTDGTDDTDNVYDYDMEPETGMDDKSEMLSSLYVPSIVTPTTPTTPTTTTTDPTPTLISKSRSEKNVTDSCQELKNIKYKMSLTTKNAVQDTITTTNNSYENLQRFLEEEKHKNKLETWNKLNKSIKHKKIEEYIDKYTIDHELTPQETDQFLGFLKDRITQGKLTKNKEVLYDKTSGSIKDIPVVVFNRLTKHITIKNIENKHVSKTIKKHKNSI